jgi:drug/metabolite transporter (DMT)-like permease
MPTLLDWSIILALGLIWATGMYFVAQAYSLALASVAAPFEYTALPINILWGFLLWHEIPVLTTWLGAILTIGSSLYILYRDVSHKRSAALAATD